MTLLEALHQTLQSYRAAAIFALQKDDPTVACLWVEIMNSCLPPGYTVKLISKPPKKGTTEDTWKTEMWGWYAQHLKAVESQNARYLQEKLSAFQH